MARGGTGKINPYLGPNVSLGHSKSLHRRKQGETVLLSHSACEPQILKQVYAGTEGLSQPFCVHGQHTVLPRERPVDVRRNHKMCIGRNLQRIHSDLLVSQLRKLRPSKPRSVGKGFSLPVESQALAPVPSWVPTNSLSLSAFLDSLKGMKRESGWPRRAMTCLDHPNNL